MGVSKACSGFSKEIEQGMYASLPEYLIIKFKYFGYRELKGAGILLPVMSSRKF